MQMCVVTVIGPIVFQASGFVEYATVRVTVFSFQTNMELTSCLLPYSTVDQGLSRLFCCIFPGLPFIMCLLLGVQWCEHVSAQ